jgi:hypothetical protein
MTARSNATELGENLVRQIGLGRRECSATAYSSACGSGANSEFLPASPPRTRRFDDSAWGCRCRTLASTVWFARAARGRFACIEDGCTASPPILGQI